MLGGPIYVARMGRRQINHESTNARFAEGVLARVDSLLEPKESRADFIRSAVDSEIRKRERRRREPDGAARPASQAPAL